MSQSLQEQIDAKVREIEALKKDRREMKQEATEKFNAVKVKLDYEREQGEKLKKEIEEAKAKIEEAKAFVQNRQNTLRELEEAQKLLDSANYGAQSVLMDLLQCNSEEEVISRVDELVALLNEEKELKGRLEESSKSSLNVYLPDDESVAKQKYEEIRRVFIALERQINPNDLKITKESSLKTRQLLAALCNVLRAAVRQTDERYMLEPLLKALCVQLKYYDKEASPASSQKSSRTFPTSFQSPDDKNVL